MNWTKLDPANEATWPPCGPLILWGCVDLEDPTRWDYLDVGVRDGADVIDGDQRDTPVSQYTHWTPIDPPGAEPTPDLAGNTENLRAIIRRMADAIDQDLPNGGRTFTALRYDIRAALAAAKQEKL